MPRFLRIPAATVIMVVLFTSHAAVQSAGSIGAIDANALYRQNPTATAEPTAIPTQRATGTTSVTAAPTQAPATATRTATNTARPSSATPRPTTTPFPTVTPIPPSATASPTNTITLTSTTRPSATPTQTYTPTTEATPGALPAPIPSNQVAVEAVRAANQWLLALACGLLLLLLSAAWLLINRSAKIERVDKQ